MLVAPREGLLVRLLLVSDSLVRLFGSSGFGSGSERSRFPWLASIAVFFGRIWDVLAGWLGGDSGAAPNTYLGCALGCPERTLVVSVVSMLCLCSVCTITSEYLLLSPFVWSACTISSEYLLPILLSISACTISAANSAANSAAEYLLSISAVDFCCRFLLSISAVDFCCRYLLSVEQGKRSSPKTLCRGPSGVLANSVFGLPVRAL